MKNRLFALPLIAGALMLAGCDNSPTSKAESVAGAVTQPLLSRAEVFENVSKNAQGFNVGPTMARQVAYVFFDPQCPHCSHLWTAAEPLKDKVRLVWIPVGLLSRASTPQGATILGAADPIKAMSINEESILNHKGGISADSDAVSRLSDKVDANTKLFMKVKGPQDGVPFIVTKVGGEIRLNSGAMPTEALKSFLGLVDAPSGAVQ